MDQIIEGFLGMSNRDLWLAFVAIAIPAIAVFVNNEAWPPLVKFLTFVLASAVGSVGFLWAYDQFQTDDFPRLLLMFVVLGTVVYQALHKVMAHVGVLSDRLLGREPAASLSPPATAIEEGVTVQVTPKP